MALLVGGLLLGVLGGAAVQTWGQPSVQLPVTLYATFPTTCGANPGSLVRQIRVEVVPPDGIAPLPPSAPDASLTLWVCFP